MASINVADKQSLLDVAIQRLGSIESVFSLALLNGLSITDDLLPGRPIVLAAVSNSDVANYFANKGLMPATAITTTTEEQARIFDETHADEFE